MFFYETGSNQRNLEQKVHKKKGWTFWSNSIMEYASFIFRLLSPYMRSRINAKHHTALRIIFNVDRHLGTERLIRLAKDIKIEERLENLKERYLTKAIENRKRYVGGRRLKYQTILCNSKKVKCTNRPNSPE